MTSLDGHGQIETSKDWFFTVPLPIRSSVCVGVPERATTSSRLFCFVDVIISNFR